MDWGFGSDGRTQDLKTGQTCEDLLRKSKCTSRSGLHQRPRRSVGNQQQVSAVSETWRAGE